MKHAVLLFATAVLALNDPLKAALLWTVAVALMHALEETKGRLWNYFGEIAGLKLLKEISPVVGFVLIVAPAILLQGLASWNAFSGSTVNVFWLCVLIGARVGDALFSHAIPFAQGHESVKGYGALTQRNPGLASAAIYLVDGFALALIFGQEISAQHQVAIAGITFGAGFFALVMPGLRLADRLLAKN